MAEAVVESNITSRANNTYSLRAKDSEQELLSLEEDDEQLLQSISSHASLPKVLNEICSALDFQIGNVVSLITP